MKLLIARVATAAALLAAALAQPQLAQHVGIGSAPAYEVHYLLGLGGNNSRGNSINDDGWIAGYSQLAGNNHRHAALWLGDTPSDLGTLGSKNKPKNSNVVWPVKNTTGLIVGISQTDAPDPWGENWSCSAFFVPATSTGRRCLGFAWENGKMRPLPTLGGTHGFAAAANNLGQIAGWAENTVRDTDTCTPPQIFQFRAVVWGPQGDEIRELPVLGDDSSSAATREGQSSRRSSLRPEGIAPAPSLPPQPDPHTFRVWRSRGIPTSSATRTSPSRSGARRSARGGGR